MKTPLHRIAQCLGVAALFAAATATAQNAFNGPYYATPSWDQTLPGASRFLVLSNFAGLAVLDRETGLVWQRSPTNVIVPLYAAALGCSQTKTGNRTGWRLPTITELGTLFDPSAGEAPFLPAGHPFTGFSPVASDFWSSSRVTVTIPGFTATHEIASYSGAIYAPAVVAGDTATAYYLCVRGPGGADAI